MKEEDDQKVGLVIFSYRYSRRFRFDEMVLWVNYFEKHPSGSFAVTLVQRLHRAGLCPMIFILLSAADLV